MKKNRQPKTKAEGATLRDKLRQAADGIKERAKKYITSTAKSKNYHNTANRKKTEEQKMEQKNKAMQQKAEEILRQYTEQTESDEDIHFEHYDWTYNDSSCCC